MIESVFIIYNIMFYAGIVVFGGMLTFSVMVPAIVLSIIPLIVGATGALMPVAINTLELGEINKEDIGKAIAIKLAMFLAIIVVGFDYVTRMWIVEGVLLVIDLIFVRRLYRQLREFHLPYRQYQQLLAGHPRGDRFNVKRDAVWVTEYVLLSILLNSQVVSAAFGVWAAIFLIFHGVALGCLCRGHSPSGKILVLVWALQIAMVIAAYRELMLPAMVMWGLYCWQLDKLARNK